MQSAGKLKVDRTPAAGYTYVNLNTADPILADKRVRQALSHLVNKQQIIDTIYKGIGKPANGPIVPGMWAYSADVPRTTTARTRPSNCSTRPAGRPARMAFAPRTVRS